MPGKRFTRFTQKGTERPSAGKKESKETGAKREDRERERILFIFAGTIFFHRNVANFRHVFRVIHSSTTKKEKKENKKETMISRLVRVKTRRYMYTRLRLSSGGNSHTRTVSISCSLLSTDRVCYKTPLEP